MPLTHGRFRGGLPAGESFVVIFLFSLFMARWIKTNLVLHQKPTKCLSLRKVNSNSEDVVLDDKRQPVLTEDRQPVTKSFKNLFQYLLNIFCL
jgi:hypothetical protein